MPMKVGTHYKQISNEQYEAAIIEGLGIFRRVAAILGITEQSVSAKIRNNPELKELVDYIRRDALIKVAVEKLFERVEKDEWPAIKLVIDYAGHYVGLFKSNEITTVKKTKKDFDKNKLSNEQIDKITDLLSRGGEVELDEFTGDNRIED